ncbi:MAG: sodium-dependent transporter [Chromatiaceae bacterium]|nr:sodium-dependent transporter [Gammaproteobacteria bacterium]MCP5306268.1 sodium-dependent transporter [Chromatiaceae bacterium]MCP5317028.1 sodium-dependent transporter [Chromatiaceae bacterium]MCP5428712.1 sodium-dependent transporter [Chromatiaceae bacterium]MCP5434556.1 sodium-dependent transporter [Chromatiaceae bacterium]
MSNQRVSMHGMWSSRTVFVMATIGSAVGLGNIWKFPYITGQYGGGAFVVVYLLCIALIGIPIMMAEILLGRRGRASPISTMGRLAREEGSSPAWSLVGYSGVVAGFLILSFYSVIAGWALAYVFQTAGGALNGVTGESAARLFGDLTGSPVQLMIWHSVFMLMTTMVVARGVRQGLERAVSVLMPVLFVMLLVMVGYAVVEGDFARGFAFLFEADFSRVFQLCTGPAATPECRFTGEPVLVAMGHAFFTLSLGMGAIMAYGAYVPEHASITGATITIAVADTAVALLAGLAIFPIVFASGLEPAAGPGLIFQTLPIAFGNMPGGQWFGTMFFVLLVFAAWSSSISIAEPAVAWLVDTRNWRRAPAAWLVGALAWLLGIASVLSFNIWSGEEYQVFGKTFFELKDFLASNVMLPLGGLLIALFVGYGAARHMALEELAISRQRLFDAWWLVIRYVSPIGIAIVFLNSVGVF